MALIFLFIKPIFGPLYAAVHYYANLYTSIWTTFLVMKINQLLFYCFLFLLFSGLKIPFPFKDKELNKIAALFNILTFLLTCTALLLPTWFKIKGLHCTPQSLSLSQFFIVLNDDDDGDNADQIILRHDGSYDTGVRDFNGMTFLFSNA